MKKVIAASLIICGCALGYAQSVDAKDSKYNLTIKSPDASQLSKHIDIPTSTHTGAVGIDIPLYTIKVGDFSLPVSLKYHASGVKVKETASKVGLGWSLSIGGLSLSKQILGREDKGKIQYINPDNFNPVQGNPNDYTLAMTLKNGLGAPDTQPDIYSYAIGGSSGEFYYDSAGKIIQIPYSTVKIEDSFVFTDNQGIKYYFKPGNQTQNVGGGNAPDPQDFNTTDFVITRILLPTGKEIKFNYLTSNYDYLSSFYKGLRVGRACNVENGTINEEFVTRTRVLLENVLQSIEFEGNEMKFLYNGREDINNGLSLSKVEIRNPQKAVVSDYSLVKDYFISTDSPVVPGFEADFPYLTKRLKLKEVVNLKDNSKYKLQYYENYPLPNRLSEQTDYVGFYNGKTFNQGIPYITYDDKTYGYGDDKRPDINYAVSGSLKEVQYPTGGTMNLEYGLDDFYFSGVETQMGKKEFLISNLEPLGGVFNVSRDGNKVDFKITFQSTTSPAEGSEGSLPEGPHFVGELLDNNNTVLQTFLINKQYEMIVDKKPSYKIRIRKVGNVNSSQYATLNVEWVDSISENKEYNKSVGGIRVEKIKNSDGNTLAQETEFIYKDANGKSTGKYMGDDIDYSYIQEVAEDKVAGYSCEQMVISNTGNFNITTINGKPTVYDKVTTRVKNISNAAESYETTDEYMNLSHTNAKNARSPIFTYANNQFARGILIGRNYYDSQKKLLKKDVITYDFDNHFNSLSNDYSAGFPTLPIRPYVIGIKAIAANFTTFTVNRYEISSAWVKKKMMKTTNYLANNSNGIDEITNYTYDTNYKHTNPMMIDVETSGSSQQTLYQYAYEKGNQKLINANMISIPLETSVTKKQNASDPAGKTLSKTETKYDDPATLFPTSVISYGINTGAQSTEVTYDKYDSNGNLQQYTTKDGIPTVIIWGYNNTKPIAKIEGVTYAQISSAASAIVSASDTDGAATSNNDETALLSALRTFRAQFPNSPVTTYTYDPLIGVRSITPPTGITEFYTYDTAGRLIKVADANEKVVKEMKYNYKN
ncbi:hypothetical protein MP478_21595 [Chryseobacterium sp. WG14]|uniref:hypothetical protein n=1 Tax=Chryseobacterium sp. WG14 TaxID=2926909 RepID=UPI00211DAC1E|nr:hypothetical protein [Chryseobacterium sp. WG14]MCQ9641985.1 hypothetical protein [Chryseobacterium sp. WG14]